MKAGDPPEDTTRPSGQPRHPANNFDVLRWVAATLVVLGHSPLLLGHENIEIWGMPISIFGVLIFFSISGYLITESWIRDPRLGRFVRKRVLRIFPALIVCVALSVLLLGPALTELNARSYWLNTHTWSYFLNCVLRMQHALPGVFASNPTPSLINGSLWTLPIEFTCYAAVAIIGVLCGRRLAWGRASTILLAVLLAAAAYHAVFAHSGRGVVVYATELAEASKLMPYFFMGSLLGLCADRLRPRLDIALLSIAALTITQALPLPRTTLILGFLAIPYLAIAFGRTETPVLRRWGRFGDFSYGLYLYAFPVQQTIVQAIGPRITTIELFFLSETIAMGFAVASWHIVEKRALTFKISDPKERGNIGFARTGVAAS